MYIPLQNPLDNIQKLSNRNIFLLLTFSCNAFYNGLKFRIKTPLGILCLKKTSGRWSLLYERKWETSQYIHCQDN